MLMIQCDSNEKEILTVRATDVRSWLEARTSTGPEQSTDTSLFVGNNYAQAIE